MQWTAEKNTGYSDKSTLTVFSQVHIFSRTSYFSPGGPFRPVGGGGEIAPYAPPLPTRLIKHKDVPFLSEESKQANTDI